jgi:hypothetical protein
VDNTNVYLWKQKKKGPLFSDINRAISLYLDSTMTVKNAAFSQLLKTYRIAFYIAIDVEKDVFSV